ncbi:MAG: metallophosphoesterase [Rubripirellula sp.]
MKAQTSFIRRPVLTRRHFFGGVVGGVSLAGGMYGWATRVEPHWLQITHHTLAIGDLPDSLQGKSLVQISDFHIGVADESYLSWAVEQVNELSPDIVAMTGDVIDHGFQGSADAVQRVFSRLEGGSLATLGCLGNHDYGKRWAEPDVADRVTGALGEVGMQMLRDEHVTVEGLSVFGLNDYWTPHFNANQVLRAVDHGRGGLCLCHNPDVCDEPVWNGFRGVILAGHTHGGQCKPPFMAPPRLPIRNRRYVSGFYDVGDDRTLFVNRGVGYGFKARFNCRPEITHFTLQRSVS